jgi:hypothetical protein
MKLAVPLLAALLVSGCSAPATATPARAASAATAAAETILASDGGVLRPIQNGDRLALRSGWATVRLTPLPLETDGQLQVSIFDADGQPASAEVSVDYASMDMDHGHMVEHGVMHEGCYQMPLTFAMPGSWRLVIHVVRAGTEETLTVVLPEVGL